MCPSIRILLPNRRGAEDAKKFLMRGVYHRDARGLSFLLLSEIAGERGGVCRRASLQFDVVELPAITVKGSN